MPRRCDDAQIRQVRRRHLQPGARAAATWRLSRRAARPEGMASAAFGKRPREEGEVEEGEVAEAAADAPPGDDAASAPAVAPPSSCTHTVAVPAGANVDPAMLVDPPSTFEGMSFPFELDAFQRIALAAVDRAESVLVAAHTSAGKTVVAQYAIATSLKRGQRVVYTSPIKALSNQKYRELAGAFDDVGLMTGDCNVNTDAAVLVMTTEILRNMLYRGHELIREVQWVVFDEARDLGEYLGSSLQCTSFLREPSRRASHHGMPRRCTTCATPSAG